MKTIILYMIGFLLFCIAPIYAQQERAVVSGRVTDAVTGESLQGAHIYLRQHRQGLSSDDAGRFKLLLPKGKTFEVTVSFVGYTTQRLHLCLQNDTTMTVRMRQDNRLADVNIYGTRHHFGVQHSQMSAIEMPIAKIENVPALFGEVDVLKALQRLPGVQSANDGQAGIYVRGGNYDQNQITMDGATLYNAEHLKGFVSAINPDMVESVVFYKGAFPARYGGQLSSVVDIGMREGDMKQYHGEVSLGMLSSKIHAEGPIWKDKTSFNVAARASYFDWIIQPLINKISENKSIELPFADVNYYDVSAKLTHRFNNKHKLSAFFYFGKDKSNVTPTGSSKRDSIQLSEEDEPLKYQIKKNRLSSGTENEWGNVVSSLYWGYRPGEKLSVTTGLYYSQYDYRLRQENKKYESSTTITEDFSTLDYITDRHSFMELQSAVKEYAVSSQLHYLPAANHNLRMGAKLAYQLFDPKVKLYQKQVHETLSGVTESLLDTITNNRREHMLTAALFVEDDWEISKRWRANIGLRYALFHVPNKSYHSVEPRLSLRWLLREDMSLKASYAHMAQGNHLLSSSNLVMPSDIWVPLTDQIPLMKSNQYAFGFNYEISKGITLSIEGYYKQMHNLLEYQEGSSFFDSNGQDWKGMVALGDGEAYGVELYAEKSTGRTTGWVSYTWSKSKRLFNRLGEELNGGRVFYSGSDRRHNFNMVVAHKFNKHWDVSLGWTYQSGKRGTLPIVTFLGGLAYNFDRYDVCFCGHSADSQTSYKNAEYMWRYFAMTTYKDRNNEILPSTHRLDVGVNYRLIHKLFRQEVEHVINLSIYNLYNRQNISTVYWGYDNNKAVLKGVCLLPFMPSISYSLKF